MYCSHSARRPRAHGSQPIRDSAQALDVIRLAMSDPLRTETLGYLLTDTGRPGVVAVISGTEEPDTVVNVADCLSAAGGIHPDVASLVIASIRTSGGVTARDVDRWLEASDVADSNGVRLVEWFVIGPSGVACPRDLLGERERWDG